MDETQALKYVKASAAALSLPLDEARAQRVAVYLLLSAGFAQALEGFALQVSDEPAEIYCPAPFPASQGGRRTP
jgi:hypothetical protein